MQKASHMKLRLTPAQHQELLTLVVECYQPEQGRMPARERLGAELEAGRVVTELAELETWASDMLSRDYDPGVPRMARNILKKIGEVR